MFSDKTNLFISDSGGCLKTTENQMLARQKRSISQLETSFSGRLPAKIWNAPLQAAKRVLNDDDNVASRQREDSAVDADGVVVRALQEQVGVIKFDFAKSLLHCGDRRSRPHALRKDL